MPLLLVSAIAGASFAQVESGGVVRKRSERDRRPGTPEAEGPQVTERMQDFYVAKEPHDADLEYMRQIYRRIDLTKDENTPLYFPEDVVDGQENLFRIILGQVVNGRIPAYEYLDGRDVPTGQVLNYYILEKWEFDRRTNQMKTRVEAICPVLNRSSDFGGDARYPMFWVKFDALRPYLAQQYIFLSDDNNLPQYSLDDYFNLGMYDGEIYKTRNLRNLSMNQMYPDEDDLKRAQDSIDNRLRSYGKHLWVPTREEYLAQQEREEEMRKAIERGDTLPDGTLNIVDEAVESKRSSVKSSAKRANTKKRATTKKAKVAKPASSSSSSANSNATKSVRRRRR